MSTFEAFAADEIVEVLEEIGIEATFVSALGGESNYASIACEYGAVSFDCGLLMSEPFFETCVLFAANFRADNPFVFVNQFNDSIRVARGVVDLDEAGLIKVDDDGDVMVYAKAELRFSGGITKGHLQFLIEMWLEDLFDFYELDSEDNDLEAPNKEIAHVTTVPLKEQIVACLSRGKPITAREISRLLGVDRQAVNSILYRERDVFERDSQQPPLWSLKN